MQIEEKRAWLKAAPAEYLLRQLCGLERGNRYGCNDEDIKLTKDEIIARMEK